MWNFFRTFDSKVTRTWMTVQVVLLSLIFVGLILIGTQRHWIPGVVSFLLSESNQPYQEEPFPEKFPPTTLPETSSLPPVPDLVKPKKLMLPNTSELLSINLPTTIERGQPMHITWQLRELPPNSSIGFFLSGTSFSFERPLILDTIPITELSGSFIWDGNRYGCDPVDVPQYCTGIATGDHVFTARIFDKTEVSLVDGNLLEPIVHDEQVTHIATQPITIVGTPGTERAEDFKNAVANRISSEYFKDSNMVGEKIKAYISQASPFTGVADAAGKFCMTFALSTPFSGTFTVCGPDKYYYHETASEFHVEGRVTEVPGVLSFQTAQEIMDEAIWLEYKDKAVYKLDVSETDWDAVKSLQEFNDLPQENPDAIQSFSVSLADWVYRLEEGGYWAFQVRVIRNEYFDQEIIIRVNNDGSACILQRYDYRTFDGTRMNIHEDTLTCS